MHSGGAKLFLVKQRAGEQVIELFRELGLLKLPDFAEAGCLDFSIQVPRFAHGFDPAF